MPPRCCVPGCKSNYDSSLLSESAVSVFCFPRDENIRKLWLKAIPRKDWCPTKYSVVCAKHFRDSDFVKTSEGRPLIRPRLNSNAVPIIFPNCPSYLSRPEQSTYRSNPNERLEKANARIEELNNNFLNSDRIKDFNDFVNNFKQQLNTEGWHVLKSSDNVVFFLVDLNEAIICDFSVKISVNNDLIVRVFLKDQELSSDSLSWILPLAKKLSLWSQISNILSRYKYDHAPPQISREFYLEQAVYNLKNADSFGDDWDNAVKLEILINQVKLLLAKRKRYDSSIIVMAFIIYSHSAAAYNLLKNFISLPSKRHLQHISSSFNISPNYKNAENDERYLEHAVKSLSEQEKIVALLIDEIYVEPSLQFKSNNIIGLAENNPQEAARTVVSFMIKSLFGKFKEIVRLVPVLKPGGNTLRSLTLDVIKFVQSLGFRILVIITDNNRTNQNMFNTLRSDECNHFANPDYPGEPIYLMYDPVHIFKNFRNNWINLEPKVFLFADFETGEVKRASFEDLRDLYFREQHLNVKKAFKLNLKCIETNNLDRQKVALVNNIFHDSTIAALESENCHETADFCKIIRKWWNIVNVKSLTKGYEKRDFSCRAIFGPSDPNIQFLSHFITWLHTWNGKENNVAVFSTDTYQAAVFTTSTLVDLASYCFSNLGVKFVLFGVFQTDDLESRFGLYRSLCGCRYKVGYAEIMESEKKIRVHNIFLHKRQDFKELIKDNGENSLRENLDISDFKSIFHSSYLADANIDDSAHLYACGYASYSVGKTLNCALCKSLIIDGKGIPVDNEYFVSMQRGGLCIPTQTVQIIFFHMCAIFQYILANENYFKIFFGKKNQKGILCALVYESLISTPSFTSTFNFDHECACGSSSLDIYSKIFMPLSNIVLNNYVKSFNDNPSYNVRRLNNFK